jgi:hypothetical protein
VSMERSRRERFRHQPVPLTWEVPLLIGVVALFGALMTPLVIQGITCALLAGGFAWPTGEVPSALLGLARGHFGAGLPAPAANELPPDPVLWATTLIGEIVVLGSLFILVAWFRGLLGIGPNRGLATSGQAAEALGIKRLRKKAPVIRPDLYPRNGRARR